MASIYLKHVGVEFPVLVDSTQQTLRNKLVSFGASNRLHSASSDKVIVHSLLDISFEARSGDRIGLIGKNGAGKSTLLKVLGGICTPTKGDMSIDGKCMTLLSVGAMIDPNRTGYENIRYMGMLLGFSDQKIEEATPDIEEFTELGEHLRLPVKTYSAGMRVRLSFAIITTARSDVLLLDEVIGAGDARFIQKAKQRAVDMYNKADILFLASHSEMVIKTICNRVLFLEEGKIIFDGDPTKAFQLYRGTTVPDKLG